MPRASVSARLRARLSAFWQRLKSAQDWAPEQLGVRSKWLEVIFIPLLSIGAAWLWKPLDPLLLKGDFPWLWFGPALVALRYGVLPGLLSSIFLLGNWLIGNALGMAAITQNNFPQDYFFGGGLLVLICGEYSDVWRDRIGRITEVNVYATERLSRLTKRHLLLNLSHDRMEQEMLARPGSLRDALISVRDLVLAGKASDGPLPGLHALLELLAKYVNVEAATIYVADARSGKLALDTSLGVLGEPLPLIAGDQLLALALETRNLAHIADAEATNERDSNQLIVCPLLASDDTLLGVLAVSKLPFYSLNIENLQMMSAILAYYTDHIRNAPDVAPYRQQLPTISTTFAEELARMVRMQKKAGITSHLVAMTLTGQYRDEILPQFLKIKRGMDSYWQTYANGNPVLVVLMPVASSAAKDGFLARIEQWLEGNFDGNFEKLHIHVRTLDLSEHEALPFLLEIAPP